MQALPLYTAVCVGRRGCVLLRWESPSVDLLTSHPLRLPYNTHTLCAGAHTSKLFMQLHPQLWYDFASTPLTHNLYHAHILTPDTLPLHIIHFHYWHYLLSLCYAPPFLFFISFWSLWYGETFGFAVCSWELKCMCVFVVKAVYSGWGCSVHDLSWQECVCCARVLKVETYGTACASEDDNFENVTHLLYNVSLLFQMWLSKTFSKTSLWSETRKAYSHQLSIMQTALNCLNQTHNS